jgi:hypothetical protein
MVTKFTKKDFAGFETPAETNGVSLKGVMPVCSKMKPLLQTPCTVELQNSTKKTHGRF